MCWRSRSLHVPFFPVEFVLLYLFLCPSRIPLLLVCSLDFIGNFGLLLFSYSGERLGRHPCALHKHAQVNAGSRHGLWLQRPPECIRPQEDGGYRYSCHGESARMAWEVGVIHGYETELGCVHSCRVPVLATCPRTHEMTYRSKTVLAHSK